MADTLTAVVLCEGADEEAGVYEAQQLKETITQHDNSNPELLNENVTQEWKAISRNRKFRGKAQ